MMRPERAFIMPRSTALDRRNTDLRLVSMTSSHSPSFMRTARLSRLIPALFTRMATPPKVRSTSAINDSILAASLTSSWVPLPWICAAARYVVIDAAPASVVAVPTTVAPCAPSSSAIARPIPRVAPVTSATCFSSCITLS